MKPLRMPQGEPNEQPEGVAADRKAVVKLLSDRVGSWESLRASLADEVVYDGPINVPVWQAH